MATISKLVVSLSANSAKLVSELAKSQRSVGKWAADVRKKAATVAKVMTAAGVAAVGAIAAIVNAQTGEIDKLAKAASALDIDTSALQKLRYQAELSGVGVDKMDQSLKRMLRSVSDAKDGTGAASEAFQKLGINAGNLSGLSADRQFSAIAEAMKGITNQADKTAIAMDIFGRSGGDLVNTLSSDLQGVGAEFDKLGIAISSQQAAMVEAYNDSKSKLDTIWNGFLNQITVAVAPAFQSVIEWITQLTVDMGGMDKVASKVMNGLAAGAGFVADAFRGWQIIIAGIQVAFGNLAQVGLRAIGSVYDAYVTLRQLIDSDFKGSDFFTGLADGFEHETDKVRKELNDLLNSELPSVKIKASIEESQNKINSISPAESTKNLIDSQARMTTATDKTAESAEKLNSAFGKTATGMSDLAKRLFGETGTNKGGKADGTTGETTFAAQPQQIRDINFESYAKAAKAASDRGDSSSFNRFIGAANDQSSRARASSFSYDNAGQKDVLNRLTGGNVEKIGTVEFKVNGTSVGLTGEPGQIKAFTDSLTKALNNEASTLAIA